MSGTSELTLMISRSDRFLHVGSADDLVQHRHQDEQQSEPVDLFDAAGRPLVPVVARDLTVVGFRPLPGAQADPDGVLRRIRAALEHARSCVADDPRLMSPTGQEVWDADGSLPEVLEALERELSLGTPRQHSSGWFHNLMHKIG